MLFRLGDGCDESSKFPRSANNAASFFTVPSDKIPDVFAAYEVIAIRLIFYQGFTNLLISGRHPITVAYQQQRRYEISVLR